MRFIVHAARMAHASCAVRMFQPQPSAAAARFAASLALTLQCSDWKVELIIDRSLPRGAFETTPS